VVTGRGGVASVVAEGSGEVDRPGAAEHADRQVVQARHRVWAGTGPTWEASSAKVTSRTQCREGFPCRPQMAWSNARPTTDRTVAGVARDG
jgi:hypothetical protein